MKRMVLLILCLLPLHSAAATPLQKAQIPASSKWLVHLDLDAFKKSFLGTLVLNEIEAEERQEMEALAELLGSNPLQDIDQITIYGPDSDKKNAVLMVSGRFVPAKLLALVTLNKTYEKIPFRDYTLHQWISDDSGENQVGVFARDNMILLSQSRISIEQALDVLDGNISALTQSDNLTCLNNAPVNPIFLMAAEDLGQLTGDHANAAILKNSDVLVFVADEDNQNFSLALDLWTQEVQSAAQIEQIILGIKAFLQLNQKEEPEVAQLLQSLQFQRQDTLISIRFRYPSEALFNFLKEHKALQEELKVDFFENQEPSEETDEHS